MIRNAKKDYTKINRSVKESAKVREHMKQGRTLKQEEIDKAINGYEKDKESGLVEMTKKGRFTQLVRYLYDPYILEKERVCIRFCKLNDSSIEGKLRTKEIIRIEFISANNNKPQYFCYINNKLKFSEVRQYEIIEDLRKYLNDF